jgi:radical SAM protein with 4Fe4S-binding SPASM domain
MNYYLSRRAVLKWLETPSVYHIAKDELYELDDESFRFLKKCTTNEGCATTSSAFVDFCMEEGLLTAERVPERRHPLVMRSPERSLRYLELQLTNACNLRCKHCFINDDVREELSPRQIRGVLAEFEEMQGLRVMLTGGEPLLHSRFGEINEMLPDFSLRKVLFTNGLLLKKDLLKTLKVDEIQVSIDGLENGHDAVRGSGTFDSSMRALRQALDAGFNVSVSTMVHSENLADFDAMERLFKEIGVKDWTVDVPCATRRLKEHAEFIVTPEEGGKYLGYGFGGGLHSSERGFGCGFHLMAVMASGKMAKCTFYEERAVGEVEQGLMNAWRKIEPVRLKDLACACEYVEVCRGGCRYRAELSAGKGGKDLHRCMFYGML